MAAQSSYVSLAAKLDVLRDLVATTCSKSHDESSFYPVFGGPGARCRLVTPQTPIQILPEGDGPSASVSVGPQLPTTLPESVCELLDEHLRYNLSRFSTTIKRDWRSAERMRYSRRQYVFEKIRERAKAMDGEDEVKNLKLAAAAMDVERGRASIDKFIARLKLNDPKVRRRKRKRVSD